MDFALLKHSSGCLAVSKKQELVQHATLHHYINIYIYIYFIFWGTLMVIQTPFYTFNAIALMWGFCCKCGAPTLMQGACGGPWMAYSYTQGSQWFWVLAWSLSPDGARDDYNGGSLNSLNGANLVKSVYCLQPRSSTTWVHPVCSHVYM